MRVEKADRSRDKGWYVGPWDSDLPIAVGFANVEVNEPHVHDDTIEIHLVARGTSVLRI